MEKTAIDTSGNGLIEDQGKDEPILQGVSPTRYPVSRCACSGVAFVWKPSRESCFDFAGKTSMLFVLVCLCNAEKVVLPSQVNKRVMCSCVSCKTEKVVLPSQVNKRVMCSCVSCKTEKVVLPSQVNKRVICSCVSL